MAHFSHPYPRFFTPIGQIPEIIHLIYHRSLGEGWFTRHNYSAKERIRLSPVVCLFRGDSTTFDRFRRWSYFLTNNASGN